MKMKMKVDLNNLINQIYEIINSSRSQKAKELGFAIDVGLKMFVSYLKEICNRAIEINDPIIMECLLNLCAISCTEEEQQDILKRVKELGGKKQ